MSRTLIAACFALASFSSAFAEDKHTHGDDIPLGTKTMGVWQVTANRMGAWEPGKDGAGSVDLVPAKPAAKAVRVWIGDAEAKGSIKSKGEAETEHAGGWHVHVEVPNPIPAGAMFWVVIETEDGKKHTESFPLEAAKK